MERLLFSPTATGTFATATTTTEEHENANNRMMDGQHY
jgi:hypothetical protein